jgi:hypothetical protein
MGKKIIRLTESDLVRLVKRVIKEEEEGTIESFDLRKPKIKAAAFEVLQKVISVKANKSGQFTKDACATPRVTKTYGGVFCDSPPVIVNFERFIDDTNSSTFKAYNPDNIDDIFGHISVYSNGDVTIAYTKNYANKK